MSVSDGHLPQSQRAAVAAQADDLAPELRRTRRQKDAAIDLSKVDRLPPHSIEAEQGVLGCCLLEPKDALSAARARLGVGAAFYDLRHQTLWLALCALEDARVAIDLITLRQHLKDAGTLDQVGGVAYLMALEEATPSPANIPFYLDIVIEKHLLRECVATFTQGVGQIYAGEHGGDVETLFARVEDNVRRLGDAFKSEGGEQTITEQVRLTMGIVETTMEHRGKGLQNPNAVPSPWPHLNKLIGGGFMRGELIVVAARPSMGKTSLACDCLLHAVLELGKSCRFYSLEMVAVPSITLRLLCSMAGCTFMDVQQGFVSEAALRGLLAAGPRLAKSPLAIRDNGWNALQIRADARRAVRAGCDLIVVDYLQIVPSGDRRIETDRGARAALVSETMKAMAKELNVPVLLLCQLNRDIEKEGGRKGGKHSRDELFTRPPQLTDLRDSGTIEQDADLVLMPWRMPEPDPEKLPDDKREHEQSKWQSWSDYRERGFRPTNLRIAKQRNGPRDMDVELAYEGVCMKFHDFHGGTGRVGGVKKVLGQGEIL